MRMAVFIWVFLCSMLMGQTKAVINGPSNSPTGSLVVLTTTGSVGDSFKWILPSEIQVASCNSDEQIFFAVGKPGKYKFILITAGSEDENITIDYVSHTVTVGDSNGGDDPTPTPAPDLNDLAKLSLQEANKVNDQATKDLIKNAVKQLHTNVEGLCKTGQCPEFINLKLMYSNTIGDALASRPRGSQSNWVPWRQSVNETIDGMEPTTVEELQAIMISVVSLF